MVLGSVHTHARHSSINHAHAPGGGCCRWPGRIGPPPRRATSGGRTPAGPRLPPGRLPVLIRGGRFGKCQSIIRISIIHPITPSHTPTTHNLHLPRRPSPAAPPSGPAPGPRAPSAARGGPPSSASRSSSPAGGSPARPPARPVCVCRVFGGGVGWVRFDWIGHIGRSTCVRAHVIRRTAIPSHTLRLTLTMCPLVTAAGVRSSAWEAMLSPAWLCVPGLWCVCGSAGQRRRRWAVGRSIQSIKMLLPGACSSDSCLRSIFRNNTKHNTRRRPFALSSTDSNARPGCALAVQKSALD